MGFGASPFSFANPSLTGPNETHQVLHFRERRELALNSRQSIGTGQSLAKQNLSIEKYNRIYNLINNDEQLHNKALKLIDEERKMSS